PLTTQIFHSSLHDALPIFALAVAPSVPHTACVPERPLVPQTAEAPSTNTALPQTAEALNKSPVPQTACMPATVFVGLTTVTVLRSEEHTSELQSHLNLVCR